MSAGRRGIGAVAASMLVSVALLAQGSVTTDAAWNDAEWGDGRVGAIDCEEGAPGFATRGEGRALSGSLLGVDLDALAEAEGVEVTNDGSTARASAGQPVNGIESAYADPLSVNALSAIQLPLTGLLELPTDNNTGVVGQFGQARSNGKALGSSGYVDDSGGIDLADDQPGGYPDLATLKLSTLLNSPLLGDIGLGDALSGVSDLELEVGAVAGQASLDGCGAAWAAPATATDAAASHALSRDAGAEAAQLADTLDRRYLAAHLTTDVESPLVGQLVSGVAGVVDDLDSTVAGLTSSTALVNGVLGGLTTLLGSLLDGLVKPTVAVTEAKISLAPVRQLLTGTIGDTGGVLTIDLSSGVISIDTSALLAQAYPEAYGDGLNGLPPNTDLLGHQDGAIITALTEALTDALGQWLSSVENALRAAIDGISLKLVVEIKVSILVTVTAKVNGTLADLRNNRGVEASSSGLVGGLLRPLVEGLITGLVGGLGGVVAKAVDDLVLPLVSGLPNRLSSLTTPIVTMVSRLYTGLFLSGLLSITVNAQNAPAAGGPPPPDWAAGLPTAPPDGRYEVAAIRVGVLDGLGQNGVRLYLGRASVGPGCSPAEAAAPGGPCASY